RGVYYDGWNPSSAPVKYGPEEYVDRFAREASIPAADVPWTAARIALITQAHFPPGQLEHARAQMPDWLSDIVAGADEPMQVDGDRNVTQADDRLEELAAA
ncbi:MAG: DUF2267 domain-containing protein, partial [Streptosporangiales bacterium]|nr:DUF2267 domain-containing protein [Streptosporangiales bacterium]